MKTTDKKKFALINKTRKLKASIEKALIKGDYHSDSYIARILGKVEDVEKLLSAIQISLK